MGALLRRWGLDAREYPDGSDLIGELRRLARGDADAESWPAFVTLDVEMPILDGRKVLRAIHEETESLRTAGRAAAADRLQGVPVIVVTANARGKDRAQLLELGATLVLNKPVDREALLAAIHTHAAATA